MKKRWRPKHLIKLSNQGGVNEYLFAFKVVIFVLIVVYVYLFESSWLILFLED